MPVAKTMKSMFEMVDAGDVIMLFHDSDVESQATDSKVI